jgi:hypothetical protein
MDIERMRNGGDNDWEDVIAPIDCHYYSFPNQLISHSGNVPIQMSQISHRRKRLKRPSGNHPIFLSGPLGLFSRRAS